MGRYGVLLSREFSRMIDNSVEFETSSQKLIQASWAFWHHVEGCRGSPSSVADLAKCFGILPLYPTIC
jgi:hypothetical protein